MKRALGRCSEWTRQKIIDTIDTHSGMTWGIKEKMMANTLVIERGEGCFLYDTDGRKILDMSSQAVCCNLGHTVPPSVVQAITDQLSKVAMVYGGTCFVEPRAELCEMLARITPGHLNAFFFPCTGSEANEAAMRIAKRVSGRSKVLSAMRGYHGGSLGSIRATGDFRTSFVEQDVNFVKFQDPNPYVFTFGTTEEEITEKALAGVKGEIKAAGVDNVACIILESIVGANGFIMYPKGYMQGLRKICDTHGIFLICDEVMMGFGRTGKWFGVENYPVVPDLMTSAKGMTAGILPMSMVAMSKEIEAKLRTIPTGWGTTYQAHPVSCAAGVAVIKYIEDNDLVGRVARMAPVLKDHVFRLAQKHEAVLMNPRSVGFGAGVDLRAQPGENPDVETGPFRGSSYAWSPKIGELRVEMLKRGVFSHVLGPHCNFAPPFIISEEELAWGFERIDEAMQCLYT